jgi:hypothetical protein
MSASLCAALSSLRSFDNALCVMAALCIEPSGFYKVMNIKPSVENITENS